MPSLLVKVQKKMTIFAHQKVRNALEGEYGSVFKGRSMDFDDLRVYVPGDDVKDIDWKATARSGQTLIRRYIAIRKHNIMLVVNTGRSMAATASSGENKRDVTVMTAGVISYIAQKHGDLIALVAGDKSHVQHMPLKGSTPHLERLLKHIDDHISLKSDTSQLSNILDYVARTIRRRMMLIIISDETEFTDDDERLFRRLQAQHEVMFIRIDDSSPGNQEIIDEAIYDVDEELALPQFIRRDVALEKAYQKDKEVRWHKASGVLTHHQITSVDITSEEDVIPQIVLLLERQKHAKRR
ncbi:MAG: DUF58 domain-containing protein [Candidatus Saccharimonadales bacterium]